MKILVISVDQGRAHFGHAPTQLTCRGAALLALSVAEMCPPWGYRSKSIYELVQDVSISKSSWGRWRNLCTEADASFQEASPT